MDYHKTKWEGTQNSLVHFLFDELYFEPDFRH